MTSPTWTLMMGGVAQGPFTRDQVLGFLADGRIDPTTPSRRSDVHRWTRVSADDLLTNEPVSVRDPATLRLASVVLTLPIATVLFALLAQTSVPYFLHPITMLLHEFGHAFVGWMCSVWALPLPYITVNGDPISNAVFLFLSVLMVAVGRAKEQRALQVVGGVVGLFVGSWFVFGPEHNPVVFLLLSCSVALVAQQGIRHRSTLTVGLAALLLMAQLACTFLAGQDRQSTAVIFGGVAGEFVGGTILSVAWFHPMPPWLRWNITRWPALAVGMLSLVSNTLDWRRYADDPSLLPFGSAINGRDDPHGDLNRLMNAAGWSQEHLIGSYLHLSAACITVLLGQYAWSVWKAYSSWRTERRPT